MVPTTCSTCKHWRKIRDEDYQIGEGEIWVGPHGQCTKIDEYSHQEHFWKDGKGDTHGHPIAKAWLSFGPVYKDSKDGWIQVENPDQYSNEADLITKAEFGCIHHEPK